MARAFSVGWGCWCTRPLPPSSVGPASHLPFQPCERLPRESCAVRREPVPSDGSRPVRPGARPAALNAAASERPSRLVILVGLSGSGKSTVGRLLSDRLGVPFIDTDAEIEVRAGRSIAEIFRSDGEPAFRAMECSVIADVLQRGGGVVAAGGGAVVAPENRAAMREAGVVVWLDAPSSELASRLISAGNVDRPLLGDARVSSLDRLRRERAAAYAESAVRIETSGKTPVEVADEITRELREGGSARGAMSKNAAQPVPTPLWVRAPSQTYPVYVDFGDLVDTATLIRAHGLEGWLRVVADERVAGLHGDALRQGLGDMRATWYLAPAGEERKTLDEAMRLYDAILADRPERGDLIVAFGGGVIGDLAGFVAATLLRGLRFVQIPTTLVSQVDSSVGGKVGVDHPRGKNLIGAFHQPSLVLADIDLLATLPPREIAAGWAEVAKVAVIQDAEFFEELERDADNLSRLDPTATARAIRRAIELKARIVEQDERDVTGLRAVLNYGHTLGHAVEAATSYGRYLHGEAVAIGMAGAAHLAHALGLFPAEAVERQARLLERLGLPQRCPGVSPSALRSAVGLDKKRLGGRTTWVLPNGIGRVRTSADVPDALVDEAIALLTARTTS
ncbi:MAG: 3-dehydroquinate synthase [Chloroflexi bacterium]|nr:3-dehydroquinate synthase [Chloroflexota bacterium]